MPGHYNTLGFRPIPIFMKKCNVLLKLWKTYFSLVKVKIYFVFLTNLVRGGLTFTPHMSYELT